MEKNEEKVLERNLEQKHFESAAEVIKDGKESGSLTNVELVENLVESYKGKTVQAPIEVIVTSAMFLNMKELLATIVALKHTLRIKTVEELRKKTDDAKAALMLAVIMHEGRI